MQIKSVFENHLSDLKIDRSLVKKIFAIEEDFANKNRDYIEFFGGAYTGVKVIRFTTDDRNRFFHEILDMDESALEDDLYKLRDDNGKPVVNEDFLVAGDVFNISCIWLIHAIHNSRYLSDKDRKEAKVRVCLYMIYRFFTSRYGRHFKYPVDVALAKATYEALSNKFILKQKGNWADTLSYIAENAVSETGIHKEVISKMNNDAGVTNMITDVQGRVRDMLKNIYGVFDRVKNEGIKITSSHSLVETDGEVILKDRTKSLQNYTRYIKGIVSDKNSFIKEDLVSVITNAMHTMPEKLFVQTLEWTSDNYSHLNDSSIDDTIDSIMDHAFEYLSKHRSLLTHRTNLVDIITKLRGTYMSSRSNEDSIVKARTNATDIVKMSVKTKNESVVASLRTGLMLYIVLRALTMKHYVG